MFVWLFQIPQFTIPSTLKPCLSFSSPLCLENAIYCNTAAKWTPTSPNWKETMTSIDPPATWIVLIISNYVVLLLVLACLALAQIQTGCAVGNQFQPPPYSAVIGRDWVPLTQLHHPDATHAWLATVPCNPLLVVCHASCSAIYLRRRKMGQETPAQSETGTQGP